uniref:WD repeat-containing protein 37 n=1 Tax=Panagrolaimus davidi TaxID=227884 RepID=A0A914PTB5_9BILA
MRTHNSRKLVATASKDYTFRLWDFRETIQSVAVFQGHNDAVTSVVFSSTHHIISGSDDRTVKVWDLRNMRSPISALRLDSAVNRLAVHQQQNLVAIPHDNRHIAVFDLRGMRALTRLPRTNDRCHRRMVCAAAWIPEHNSNNLISCGIDRQIIGWKIPTKINA